MLFIPSFNSLLYEHILLHLTQSLRDGLKCLKKWFGFHFQASSSTYESLIRAYPKVKKNLH